jgi:DNA-binding MarR family transcriptional regulator
LRFYHILKNYNRSNVDRLTPLTLTFTILLIFYWEGVKAIINSIGKDKKSKDQVMYEAHLQYGYTLKEIAEYIGVHYSTVSRAIKKIEGEDEK